MPLSTAAMSMQLYVLRGSVTHEAASTETTAAAISIQPCAEARAWHARCDRWAQRFEHLQTLVTAAACCQAWTMRTKGVRVCIPTTTDGPVKTQPQLPGCPKALFGSRQQRLGFGRCRKRLVAAVAACDWFLSAKGLSVALRACGSHGASRRRRHPIVTECSRRRRRRACSFMQATGGWSGGEDARRRASQS
jgi:hypothetical protein